MKPNPRPLGAGFIIIHDLPDGLKDEDEHLVMVEELAFEGVEFAAEVLVGYQQPARRTKTRMPIPIAARCSWQLTTAVG